MQGKTKVVAS